MLAWWRAPHPPTGSGSRHDRRLRIQPGVCPRGLTARTRVRPVAARCPRAEWTVSCDLPSVVRNDDRTATLVRLEHPRTGRRPLLHTLASTRARWRGFSRVCNLVHTKTPRHKDPALAAKPLTQPSLEPCGTLQRWTARDIFVPSCDSSSQRDHIAAITALHHPAGRSSGRR